jgi:hypothetical protein
MHAELRRAKTANLGPDAVQFTEDDDDVVIGVGDDGVMRIAPLGERDRCRRGGGVPVDLSLGGERRSTDFAAQRMQRRQHVALDCSSARCRLIGQGCLTNIVDTRPASSGGACCAGEGVADGGRWGRQRAHRRRCSGPLGFWTAMGTVGLTPAFTIEVRVVFHVPMRYPEEFCRTGSPRRARGFSESHVTLNGR